MQTAVHSQLKVMRIGSLAAKALASVIVLAASAMTLPAVHAQTFTVLYTFTNTDQGWQPDAAPIVDQHGNLFGTTQYGGTAGGFGTVYELDSSGKETVLYSFSGTPDGEDPEGGLFRTNLDYLYGTTIYGGTGGGFGTVFQLATSGKLTLLHSFSDTPDGADPHGSLVADRQHNGYGTTQYGGSAGGYGTIFKVSQAGEESILYSFSGTPDGEDPEAGLVRDAAGNLYGTTVYGGTAGGYGTVFKLAPSGTLTLLHSFAGTPDGENPYAALAADSSGNGYGTTKYGGTAGGYGTVFKISRTGSFSLLHSFSGTPDGENPVSSVIVDPTGNVYGTTFYGGESGYGSVFEIDTTGKLTILHSFTGTSDGANPMGGLSRDALGDLYGATTEGGDLSCGFSGCGVIFKVTP